MQTLGVWLRQAREAQGDTLKDAEAATRIRARFLEALEAGDFSVFPGNDVQTRGFLRIYARYLGLPLDEVLARYNAEAGNVEPAALATASAEAQTQSTPSVRSTSRTTVSRSHSLPFSASLAHRTSPETLIIVGIVLIILLAVATGVGYLLNRNADEQASAAATTIPPSETTLPPMATPAQPIVTPTFPADLEGKVTLTLEATEHVWVRVTRDGQTAFQGMLTPSQVETWSSQETIIVDTGNGAGLQVTINGQPQGTVCGRGQVCTRAWGPNGEVAAPSPAPASVP